MYDMSMRLLYIKKKKIRKEFQHGIVTLQQEII